MRTTFRPDDVRRDDRRSKQKGVSLSTEGGDSTTSSGLKAIPLPVTFGGSWGYEESGVPSRK